MINIIFENTERKTYLYDINWGINCPNFIFFTHNIPTIPGLTYFISYKNLNNELIETSLDFSQLPAYVIQFALEFHYNALDNNIPNDSFYKFQIDINFQNCNNQIQSKILDFFEFKILGNQSLICSYPPLNPLINIIDNPLEIHVNWDSVPGTQYYEISYNDRINFYKELISDTHIILNNLNIKRNNTYFLDIKAVCSNNITSKPSISIQFSTPLQLPEQYPNSELKNFIEENNQIKFYLLPPDDKLESEIAYLLEWGLFDTNFQFNTTSKIPELIVTNYQPNTKYYFRFKTIYLIGESNWSSLIEYTTQPDLTNQSLTCLSPDKVTYKEELNGNYFNLIINYKDNLSSLISTEVYIRWKKLNDTSWIETKAVLPIIIENLDKLYPYEFSLKSICNNIESEWSPSFPVNNDFYCLVSDGLETIAQSQTSILIKWNKPNIINGNIIKWNLYWKESNSNIWNIINVDTNEYLLDNLLTNTYYNIGIETICQRNISTTNDSSNILYTEVKTLFKELPCPNPINIQFQKLQNNLLVSWNLDNEIPLPFEYKIQWKEINTLLFNEAITKLNNYTIQNILNGITYEIIITTICGNERNKYEGGNILSYYKDPLVISQCLSPYNLTINNINNGIQLKWNYFNNLFTKFKIIRKKILNNEIKEYFTNKLYYDFFDILLNEPYEFSVITICQNDISNPSSTLLYTKNSELCETPKLPILQQNKNKFECFDVLLETENNINYKFKWFNTSTPNEINEILLNKTLIPYTICPDFNENNEIIVKSNLTKLCGNQQSLPTDNTFGLKLYKCKKIESIHEEKNNSLVIRWENINDALNWRIYWNEGNWISNPNQPMIYNELTTINQFNFGNLNYLIKIVKNCSENEKGITDEFTFLIGNYLYSNENNYLIEGDAGDNGGWISIWIDWLNEINSEGMWVRWGNEVNGIIRWKEWNKQKLRGDNILSKSSAWIINFDQEIINNIWFEFFQFNDTNQTNWKLIRKKLSI